MTDVRIADLRARLAEDREDARANNIPDVVVDEWVSPATTTETVVLLDIAEAAHASTGPLSESLRAALERADFGDAQ